MRIRSQCRVCGMPFGCRISRDQDSVVCPNCADSRSIDLSSWSTEDCTRIEKCLICECKHLYRQKDVNRALGCLLVAIGAVFVPWTYGLSLVFLALIDLILYYRLPQAVVCYKCDTVFREARPGPRQNEFDLLKHDVLKYGKSWQDLKDN